MAAKPPLGLEPDSAATELDVLGRKCPIPPCSTDSEAEGEASRADAQDDRQTSHSFPAADEYPTAGEAKPEGVRLVLLLTCLYTGSFLVGYDSSCLGTLIPVITDHFHALDDLGWFQTAYLLGLCSTMLIYGRLYTAYSMKKLYISSLSVFIVGSIVTATSPTASVFILGRTITGLGAAGLNSGSSIILAFIIPLERRPTYFAISGGVICSTLAFGPLVSGSIAHYTTWRVPFAIGIPVASVIILILVFGVGSLRRRQSVPLGLKQKLAIIDWGGFATQLPTTACIILALQWAGVQYPWDSWRIILLFVITCVLTAAFFFIEHKSGESAMLPLRMLRRRTVTFANIVAFCNFSAMYIVSFYLPLYFQAIRGASTLGSGLMILPLALSQSFAALTSGPITTRIGYYSPSLLVGTSLSTVGSGLLTTLHPSSPAAHWISFQIIYGLGIGLAYLPPSISVQTVLEGGQIPLALALLGFAQIFGAIVSLSAAQNVFLDKLAHNLVAILPQADRNLVLNNGAVGLLNVVPERYREQVLIAYNGAIVDAFYMALAFTGLAVLCSFGIEWKSVKKPKNTQETASEVEDKR